METEVKYQMATDNGYDCEVITSVQDARAFFERAMQRATSPVWIWEGRTEVCEIPREQFRNFHDLLAAHCGGVF